MADGARRIGRKVRVGPLRIASIIRITVMRWKRVLAACVVALSAGVSCGSPDPLPAGEEVAPACASSQSSAWKVNLDSAASVLATDRDGHVLTVQGGLAPSALLESLDNLGHVRWTATTAGGVGGIAASSNRDILIAGGVAGTEPTDPSVRIDGTPRSLAIARRLGEDGSTIWTSTISDDAGDIGGEFVGEAPDGTIFVAGSINYDEAPPRIPNQLPNTGFFAAHLSSSGQVVWEHHWDHDDASRARGYVIDAAGRLGILVWVTGMKTLDDLTLGSPSSPWAGDLVWFGTDGRATAAIDVTEDSDERFDGVSVDAEGRLYVHGWILKSPLGSPNTIELVIAAVAPSGEHLWAQRFHLSDGNGDTQAAVDACGDVLFVGNGDASSFLAARISRDGEVKSQMMVPLPDSGWANNVAAAPGGMYVGGATGMSFQNGFLSRLGL
jgi:hypothetical protein